MVASTKRYGVNSNDSIIEENTMSTSAKEMMQASTPAFTQGIKFFAEDTAEFTSHGQAPVIASDQHGIDTISDAAVYQTLLAADALRYLTLQVCSSKESGVDAATAGTRVKETNRP